MPGQCNGTKVLVFSHAARKRAWCDHLSTAKIRTGLVCISKHVKWSIGTCRTPTATQGRVTSPWCGGNRGGRGGTGNTQPGGRPSRRQAAAGPGGRVPQPSLASVGELRWYTVGSTGWWCLRWFSRASLWPNPLQGLFCLVPPFPLLPPWSCIGPSRDYSIMGSWRPVWASSRPDNGSDASRSLRGAPPRNAGRVGIGTCGASAPTPPPCSGRSGLMTYRVPLPTPYCGWGRLHTPLQRCICARCADSAPSRLNSLSV